MYKAYENKIKCEINKMKHKPHIDGICNVTANRHISSNNSSQASRITGKSRDLHTKSPAIIIIIHVWTAWVTFFS